MLTIMQKASALHCLSIRPPVIEGTRVIPDDTARLQWFDSVMEAMKAQGIKGMRDITEFCDLAGVPD